MPLNELLQQVVRDLVVENLLITDYNLTSKIIKGDDHEPFSHHSTLF